YIAERCFVEHTYGWQPPLAPAKDCENLTRSHLAFVILVMIRLMLRRIVRLTNVAQHARTDSKTPCGASRSCLAKWAHTNPLFRARLGAKLTTDIESQFALQFALLEWGETPM